MKKFLLVIFVDLITMTQELLEGDSAERHGIKEIQVGTCGGESTIQALDESR